MKVFKSITGHCPKFNKLQTIEVESQQLNILGQEGPHYKRLGYTCDYESFNGCEVSDIHGYCPIYDSSINR